MPEPADEKADLAAPLAEFDAVLRRCVMGRALRRLLLDASGLGEDYLFVFAEYSQLIALRGAARAAADNASGDDRRLLDRFVGRTDALATTLSAFLDDTDLESGSRLN